MRYLNNMMSPNALMERTWGAIVVGVIGAGVSMYSASKNRDLAEGMATDASSKQAKAQAQLEKEKEVYKNIKIKNMYANMENPYEDLTVNQQQAQFQSQQMEVQRANIMRGLRGAAGASGIASLAQAMANQGQLSTQRISASIGQQEARNQVLMARGAAAADITERGGEQWVQAAEMDRSATILGMEYGEAAGANLAAQTSQTNEINAMLASQQTQADMVGVLGTAAGNVNWGGGGGGYNPTAVPTIGAKPLPVNTSGPDLTPRVPPSDRRLKKNISKISESPSGLNVYSFEYKDSKHGEGLFQGVMSDEIPQNAVMEINGYDHVDYSKIDVNFKQI